MSKVRRGWKAETLSGWHEVIRGSCPQSHTWSPAASAQWVPRQPPVQISPEVSHHNLETDSEAEKVEVLGEVRNQIAVPFCGNRSRCTRQAISSSGGPVLRLPTEVDDRS